jgi:hypothetical protein
MQYDEHKTIPSLTRNDGIKTAAFVVFCLVISSVMIIGTLALWLVR